MRTIGSFWTCVKGNTDHFDRECPHVSQEQLDAALDWLREGNASAVLTPAYYARRPVWTKGLSDKSLAHLQFLAKHS